jgi:hypothetical protein
VRPLRSDARQALNFSRGDSCRSRGTGFEKRSTLTRSTIFYFSSSTMSSSRRPFVVNNIVINNISKFLIDLSRKIWPTLPGKPSITSTIILLRGDLDKVHWIRPNTHDADAVFDL